VPAGNWPKSPLVRGSWKTNKGKEMNVYLQEWSPRDTLKRFYVKREIDGSEIGYIQLSYKPVGYGNGYYSRHRAAKGDFGTLELTSTSLVGDEEILQKVIDKALQTNDVEIANSLGLISRNANVLFWEKGAARKAKQRAQKNLTVSIANSN
jgi:hypothetical protein